ncbi:DUF6461 domain-containing protein [Actinophytocola sp.]|uniref:DUF6461 domain-containing protein n=1 Tax=Actinophytocola sp. TaxID=1872138 RepID=UPI00389B2774
MTGVDDLAWADASPEDEMLLDEIFCLTFVKAVDDTEVLRRMGALPDSVATRTPADLDRLDNFDDGYPTMASTLRLASWTVVVERSGFQGAELLPALSHETEAVCVLRHDYASHTFAYAAAGELITQFDPFFPAQRYGADPDRLLSRMLDVGFAMDDDGFDHNFDGAITRSLRLAEEVTGVLPTLEALTGPLTSARIEPWFSDAPKPPATRPGHDSPVDPVAEVRRLTDLHGLNDTPGLAEALRAAERATPVVVTPDSPLGQHVRTWLTESRRAGRSANDHNARHRMTDTERRRAFDLGWLAVALGAALQPSSRSMRPDAD